MILSVSALYFVITGIQFWISDYFISVLGVSRETVYVAFPLICISGPVLGVIVGGIATHQIGGYTNPKALGMCCFVGFFASVFGIPIPFLDNFYLIVIFLWMLLFCGGFIMMPLTGMIINTAPKSIKAVSNSIAFVFYNLLGYLPAPFVYGSVQSLTGGNQSRGGLITTMMVTVVGNFFLFLVLIYRIGTSEQVEKEMRDWDTTDRGSQQHTHGTGRPGVIVEEDEESEDEGEGGGGLNSTPQMRPRSGTLYRRDSKNFEENLTLSMTKSIMPISLGLTRYSSHS